MTDGPYEIGVVDDSSIDAERNVMLLICGEGTKGEYKIGKSVTLKLDAETYEIEVGNLKFPKGIDGGLFLHGKVLGNLPVPETFSGFQVYV